MAVIEPIARLQEEMTSWRRDIHAHPELGFEEHRTSALVAEKLRAFGIEVHRGVGRTGVVGVLRDGNAASARSACAPTWTRCRWKRRTISPTARARRAGCTPAGMTGTRRCCSAPPVISRKRAASTAPCISSSSRPRKAWAAPAPWWRTGCSGASPAMPSSACTTGRAWRSASSRIRPGAMMAGGAFFDIRVTGKGGHGARPEAGVDPVLVARRSRSALQSDGGAQRAPGGGGGGQRHARSTGASLQRHPGARGTARHGARLHAPRRWRWSRRGCGRWPRASPPASAPRRSSISALISRPVVNDAERGRLLRRRVPPSWWARTTWTATGRWSMASEDFAYMLDRVPGRLHRHRQRRGRGRLRGPQPRLRLQRRRARAWRERVRAHRREAAAERRLIITQSSYFAS